MAIIIQSDPQKPQKLETLKRVNLKLLFVRDDPKLAIWNVSVLITDRRVSTKKKDSKHLQSSQV
jgi:hypothetical protein